MRFIPIILLAIFVVLWFSNTEIIKYLSDYDIKNPSTHHLYKEIVIMKDIVYETMFVICLLLGIFKKTFLSKVLAISMSIIVVASILDKIQGITDYHVHDIIIVFGSFYVSYIIYRKYVEKQKT